MVFRNVASSLSKKFIKRNDTSRLENSARTRKTVIEPLERREMLSAAPDYGILCTVITYDEYLARTALAATEQTTPTFSYAKNMSFKEIADTTGVSINTALGRMRYAILNMRRIAEEHDITLTM